MTGIIIILVCSMLLLAYLAELSAEKTRIPAIIILLFLGWLAGEAADVIGWNIPDLHPVLPFLGTIGLILIVLEGALELTLDRSKVTVIKKSFLMALVPLIVFGLLAGIVFSVVAGVPFRTGLINSLPFSVISSSIAIPASKNISGGGKEFVIYESSLSDVVGVLLFNFVLLNDLFTFSSIWLFLLQLILISLISILSVAGLSFLLSRIRNHISYTPIILLAILIYAIAKEFELSGLLFILIFGLFLGNLRELKRFWLVQLIDSERLNSEVKKFRSMTIEATFIVRSLFFLLFGFLMETKDFISIHTLPWAAGIVTVVLGIRWLFLKTFKIQTSPLLFFSPRGLITILLFISITPDRSIPFINNSLIVQVIILSVLIMLLGVIKYSWKNKPELF